MEILTEKIFFQDRKMLYKDIENQMGFWYNIFVFDIAVAVSFSCIKAE